MVYGKKEEKGHTMEVIELSVVGVACLTVVGNLGGSHPRTTSGCSGEVLGPVGCVQGEDGKSRGDW